MFKKRIGIILICSTILIAFTLCLGLLKGLLLSGVILILLIGALLIYE